MIIRVFSSVNMFVCAPVTGFKKKISLFYLFKNICYNYKKNCFKNDLIILNF